MKESGHRARQSFLFRTVAFLSRHQFSYLYRNVKNQQSLALVFVFVSGATALATIALAAYLVELPLLFPPLGPSAFILFYTPMSKSASPRNFILSHSCAVCAGLLSLEFCAMISPAAGPQDFAAMTHYHMYSVGLAMGLISGIMIWLDIAHPPAAATALIAAMGYLDDPLKVAGIIAAVIMLAVEGVVFNRLLGGMPYPLWRTDVKAARSYGVLAGIPRDNQGFWEQLAQRIQQRR